MKVYNFTDIDSFEKEINKVSSQGTELLVQTDKENYETVKEKILDSCYNVEDYDKENHLLIVKWTHLSLNPVRKIVKNI